MMSLAPADALKDNGVEAAIAGHSRLHFGRLPVRPRARSAGTSHNAAVSPAVELCAGWLSASLGAGR
jgi:hypothetical protein